MFFIKRWLRVAMGFSRAESNGFIILLPLVTIIVFSEPLTRWIVTRRTNDFSHENRSLDSLMRLTVKTVSTNNLPQTEKVQKSKHLSTFDPNKISSAELSQLGFSKKIADRIIKYRGKGGRFKIKSDLAKIYGMDSALYHNLYPFILLPEKIDNEKQAKISPYGTTFEVKKHIDKFDLNKTDTTQLKTIFGIGPTLANRIVKYRSRLGGFIDAGQLKEVYGLDSTVINKLLNASFLGSDFQAVKLNINTCTEKELQTHPYITRAMAKAIVTYRFQHGNFANVEEIRNLFGIKNETASKLIPYLKVGE